MRRIAHALVCLFACGCWLIGDMGDLTNEGLAGGGNGGTGGSGAAGGMGGSGASGGTGGAPVCEALSLSDGDFDILAVCHGVSQPRLSADGLGVAIAGQLDGDGFAQSFSPDGAPLASASILNGRALRVQIVGPPMARTTLVGGTVGEAEQLGVLGEERSACAGASCGFLAVFDAPMTSALTYVLDAGPTGSVAVDDVDTGVVGELGDDLVVAIGGTMRGTTSLFGVPISSTMQESAFVVTANIQSGAAKEPTVFVVPAPSREVNLTINQKNALDFLVFATYTEEDQATFSVIDPQDAAFVGVPTAQSGVAKSVTRMPSGAAYTIVDGDALSVRRTGSVTTGAGPFQGITVGRARADRDNNLWIASGYDDMIDLDGPPLTSVGGRDHVLIFVPEGETGGAPRMLSASSTEDDQFTDVATVTAGAVTFVYAVLAFSGTIEVDGRVLTAPSDGSTLLVRLTN